MFTTNLFRIDDESLSVTLDAVTSQFLETFLSVNSLVELLGYSILCEAVRPGAHWQLNCAVIKKLLEVAQ
jgi:hypothetical protein